MAVGMEEPGGPTTLVDEGRRGVAEEGAGGIASLVAGLRLSPDDDRCCGGHGRPHEGGGDDADGGGGDVVAATVRDHGGLTTETTAGEARRLRGDPDGGGDGDGDDDDDDRRRVGTMMKMMTLLEQEEKRLVLVLDLDHTLLHSIRAHRLTPREAYLIRQESPRRPVLLAGRHPTPRQPPSTVAAGIGGGGDRRGGGGQRQMLFNMTDTLGCLTKLRPFIHTFLREANTMYHLCICTMGDRTYAHQMARLLDPDGAYFVPGDNIISREDFTEKDKKGLDVVRRGDERTTVILDDMADVWGEKHRANLIHIPEYHYFADTRRGLGFTGPSWAELRRDENESAGELARALHHLRQTHRAFFDTEACGGGGNPATKRGVRDILRRVTKKKREPPISAARWLRPQQQAQVQRHQLQA